MRKCEPSGSDFFYPAYLIEFVAAEKTSLQRHNLPFTLQRTAARDSSRYLKPFLWDVIVLHLADKTSASTTSAANSMLAISENVACSGCAWKWRPRSVRVRMVSLPAEENGITQHNSRPCDTNSLFKLDSKSTKIAVNNRAFQSAVADRSSRVCLTDTLLRLRL
jgi:hypothetical protein